MAKVHVRSLPHRNRQVSVPRPERVGTDAVSNVVVFDENGVAEVTQEQADFLVYQFDSAEVVKPQDSK